jgi:hypothetical protein
VRFGVSSRATAWLFDYPITRGLNHSPFPFFKGTQDVVGLRADLRELRFYVGGVSLSLVWQLTRNLEDLLILGQLLSGRLYSIQPSREGQIPHVPDEPRLRTGFSPFWGNGTTVCPRLSQESALQYRSKQRLFCLVD